MEANPFICWDILGSALECQDIYLVSHTLVSERHVAYTLRDAETVSGNSELALGNTEFLECVHRPEF
jgi:hypothetical protein